MNNSGLKIPGVKDPGVNNPGVIFVFFKGVNNLGARWYGGE